MENTYQFGPVSISKSFVQQPLFWPGVIAVIFVAVTVVALSTGHAPSLNPTPTPSLKAQVFPLNQQFARPLLYSSGTTIYRTTGQSEEKLFEVGSEVLTMTASKDGSHLAATYKLPSGGANSTGYPYSSLIFWDMNTKKSLPIIAEQRTTVRYPQWSDDGRYLAFWVNEGEESFIYDTARRRPSFSVKRDGSSTVSPIVFLPNTIGIAYIKDGTLYSAAIDGTRPIPLAEQVASTRSAGGMIVASAPIVSPDGAHIAYYTFSGDLAVVNTTTREVKTLASQMNALGFLNNDEVLYTLATPNVGDAPTLFRFSIAKDQTTRINNSVGFLAKDAWFTAAVPLTTQNAFYLPSFTPNIGPQLFSKDGTLQKDCSTAEFHYTYDNNSSDTSLPEPSQVVSPDGKYLAGTSGVSLSVMDTATCQPYFVANTTPTAMTWMK